MAQWATERPCSVCRTSVFCLQNVHALFAERPCSVCRTSMLCLQNVRVLFAERPCSVCRTSMLCPCISVLSAAYPQRDWLAKLPIVVAKTIGFPKSLVVVAERKSPSNFQGASHSNSQHLICRYFSAIPQTLREMPVDSSWGVRAFFMKCPQSLREVSADSSWITALWIRGLTIRLFRGNSTLLVSCIVRKVWSMLSPWQTVICVLNYSLHDWKEAMTIVWTCKVSPQVWVIHQETDQTLIWHPFSNLTVICIVDLALNVSTISRLLGVQVITI